MNKKEYLQKEWNDWHSQFDKDLLPKTPNQGFERAFNAGWRDCVEYNCYDGIIHNITAHIKNVLPKDEIIKLAEYLIRDVDE